jgi:hypothetical protein
MALARWVPNSDGLQDLVSYLIENAGDEALRDRHFKSVLEGLRDRVSKRALGVPIYISDREERAFSWIASSIRGFRSDLVYDYQDLALRLSNLDLLPLEPKPEHSGFIEGAKPLEEVVDLKARYSDESNKERLN